MERIINIEAHVRRWQLELGKAVEIIADKERKNIKLESAAIQECGFDDGVFPYAPSLGILKGRRS